MRKVTIIGAGPGNPDLLSRAALDAIDIADVVIGAHRALAGIDVPPDVTRKSSPARSPSATMSHATP